MLNCTPLRWLCRFAPLTLLAVTIGCGGTTSAPAPSAVPVVSQSADPPVVPDMSAALSEGKINNQQTNSHGAPPSPTSVTENEQTTGESPPTEMAPKVEEERQVAVAGVGRKGKDYGGGIISEPVSAYFGARERIAFISVQKAMRTFEALHERAPNSHEEFMKEIIQENGIDLPALLDDERYEYDPEYSELMVVRPKRQ